jgi:hypothetical protein
MQIPKTIIDLEALLIALEQQTESLPEDIQRSLKEVGQLLEEKRPEAPQKLRQLIKDYSPLEKAYQKAIEELDAAYADRERAKSLSAIFPDTLDIDALFIHDVIPSWDWVKTAQKLTRDLAIPNIPATPSRFWDKADRLMVVTVGGAALGGRSQGFRGRLSAQY